MTKEFKKEEYFYMFEAYSDLLLQIDPSLRNISHALIVSTPFDNGAEANIYMTHITDNLKSLSDGELIKTENPSFFPATKQDDFSDWDKSVMTNVVIYNSDDSVMLGGRLMATNVSDLKNLTLTVQ